MTGQLSNGERSTDAVATDDALFDRFAYAAADKAREVAASYEELVDRLIQHCGLDHLRGNKRALELALRKAMEDPKSQKQFGELFPEEWNSQQQTTQLHVLPTELVQSWEHDFITDARYWQLLSMSIAENRNIDCVADHYSRLHPGQYEALIEGYRKGAADGALLLMLRPLYAAAAEGYAQQHLENLRHMSEDVDPQEQAAMHRQSIEHFRQQYGDKYPERIREMEEAQAQMEAQGFAERWRDPLLEQIGIAEYEKDQQAARRLIEILGLDLNQLHEAAVEASPDWAQMYYERAVHHHRNGRPEAALADVSAGNAAGTNRLLIPFPSSHVIVLAQQDRIAGNLFLVIPLSRHSEFSLTMAELRGVVKALGEVSVQDRVAHLQNLLRMTCRCGRADLAGRHEAIMAMIVVWRRLENVRQWVSRKPGVTEITEVMAEAQKIHAIYSEDSFKRLFSEDYEVSERFPLTWEESEAQVVPLYRQQFQELIDSHRFAARHIRPFLERVEAVDLVAMI